VDAEDDDVRFDQCLLNDWHGNSGGIIECFEHVVPGAWFSVFWSVRGPSSVPESLVLGTGEGLVRISDGSHNLGGDVSVWRMASTQEDQGPGTENGPRTEH